MCSYGMFFRGLAMGSPGDEMNDRLGTVKAKQQIILRPSDGVMLIAQREYTGEVGPGSVLYNMICGPALKHARSSKHDKRSCSLDASESG